MYFEFHSITFVVFFISYAYFFYKHRMQLFLKRHKALFLTLAHWQLPSQPKRPRLTQSVVLLWADPSTAVVGVQLRQQQQQQQQQKQQNCWWQWQ